MFRPIRLLIQAVIGIQSYSFIKRRVRRVAYRGSDRFEADVTKELARLKADGLDRAMVRVQAKLGRDEMPPRRRQVWKEAARRLAKEKAAASR